VVLDRGFYSESNISYFASQDINFIIAIPLGRKVCTRFLSTTTDTLVRRGNSFLYQNESLYCMRKSDKIGTTEVELVLYCDQVRQAQEREALMLNIHFLLNKINETHYDSLRKAHEAIREISGLFHRCFSVQDDLEHSRVVLNNEAIEKLLMKKGKFVLATNSTLNNYQVVELYRKKDEVEKIFDDLKNELKEKRFRTKTTYTFDGKMLLNFLCLIVISEIRQHMKNKELYKRHTLRSVFKVLNKIKVIELSNGKRILTELTATQKAILQDFSIKAPTI
jgi:transposase